MRRLRIRCRKLQKEPYKSSRGYNIEILLILGHSLDKTLNYARCRSWGPLNAAWKLLHREDPTICKVEGTTVLVLDSVED